MNGPGALPPPGPFAIEGRSVVPEWTKVLTLIVGLAAWSATVIVTFVQGNIPDLGILGFPAGLILALAPPIRIGRNGADPDAPAGAEQEASAS
jgi:hypothetical protein